MVSKADVSSTEVEGFALLAVLAFLLVVSAVIAPFATTARTRLMIASNQAENQRLSLLAEGLTNVLATELTGEIPAALKIYSELMQCSIPPYNFDITIQDHTGLIDLNAANDETLSVGFRSLGFDEAEAAQLATSVVAFRTASTGTFSEGIAGGVGLPTSKHAPFESVSELQDFQALARFDLWDLLNVFTVRALRGVPSADRAPMPVRQALRGKSRIDSSIYQGAGIFVYSIEVAVGSNRSGITGHAGYVVETESSEPGGFRRVSAIPRRQSGILLARQSVTQNCDTLFGSAVSNTIREWGNE